MTIADDPDEVSFVSYAFRIDDDVVALAVRLDAAADLDLYLDTRYIEDYDDVLASSEGYSGTELLQLDLTADPALISDVYYLDVAYGRTDPPVTARGQPMKTIPFTVTVTPYRLRNDGEIVPGKIVTDRIEPRSDGPYRNYVIDVPEGSRKLRIDLASDATDLDLRVRRGRPMRTIDDADAVSASWSGNETVVIDNGADPIPAGRYFVDVFDQAWLDWPAAFRVVASFEDKPPVGLVDLPSLARAKGLDGAVSSTVEILLADGGGTGVLLSDTGYILTNYHVVSSIVEAGPSATESPMIGLTVDPSEGSRVRVLARIVATDEERDIALLQAATDLYGQALPDGYRFPFVERGNPRDLSLGDPLIVLGYPDAGSLGTRVSITETRGIVSGFERRGDTLLIKTDADIAAGNSGGPVLDEHDDLIGIATETISEEFGNSQIGYIWPLWLVPADWWALVDAGGGDAGH